MRAPFTPTDTPTPDFDRLNRTGPILSAFLRKKDIAYFRLGALRVCGFT